MQNDDHDDDDTDNDEENNDEADYNDSNNSKDNNDDLGAAFQKWKLVNFTDIQPRLIHRFLNTKITHR